MARKRAKRVSSDPVVDVDRISSLPDPLIHHILSFVPTVFVVRMSVLSRRWRRMWHSVPTLCFPSECIPLYLRGFLTDERFNLFVEKCMKHRRRVMRYVADSTVTSFKLEIGCSLVHFAGLNKWFQSSTVMHYVKELDLSLQQRGNHKSYRLPSAVLNGRCLTLLKLSHSVKISKSCSVNLPSLKTLWLSDVFMDTEVLYNLVLGCPFLKECILVEIMFTEELRISSLSLKYLDVQTECETTEAKLDALNLETLVLRCGCCFPYDFTALTGIKDLFIENLVCCVDIESFEDQLPKLTLLKNLTVTILTELEPSQYELKINNWSLKNISFVKHTEDEFKLTIDTSWLHSFDYFGDAKCSFSCSSRCVNGKFSLSRKTTDKSWYTELITFLSNVKCRWWESVDLVVDEDKDLIVPKNLRVGSPPWPDLKHLTVSTKKASRRKAEFRKALKWFCPSLKTLTIE